MFFNRTGVARGSAWARIAAAPATCGVAIDVPDMVVYVRTPRPPARAATTSTPGAERSGFASCPPTAGPRLENDAVAPSRSAAATVSASAAQPGVDTVPRAPRLPAAITNRDRSDRALTASTVGPVQEVLLSLIPSP
ncbi:hypothetical protein QWJ26_25370 [Streptomyces sp. CSDS2]|nr:hypothetical protein [Streptomyces sp. CSDS2]MDN3263081.1 hypothetical protein [Streptomyces sp. CSDS2]